MRFPAGSGRLALGALLVALAGACGGPGDGDPVPEVPGAVHRFAEADGTDWHWVEAGEGPPVVLLHGMPQSWFAWRHQLDALSSDHRVIAPDLPGFGLSDRHDGDYSPSGVADSVAAWLRSLQLDEVALVGHDWGGLVGAWLAAGHPDLVSRYVHLSAPLERFDLGRIPDYRTFHESPGTGARFMASADLFVPRVMERSIYGGLDAYPEEALQRHVRELRRPGVANAVARYFRDLELGPGDRLVGDSRPPWRELTLPVLLIGADRDQVQPWETYMDAEELIPGLREVLILDDAGHFAHEERPEVVSEALRDFLEAP